MALGKTLEACAAAYKRFCERYRPKPKTERKSHWGSRLLENLKVKRKPTKKVSPGQKSLWQAWTKPEDNIQKIAKKFVLANALNPEFAQLQFET